MNKPLRKKNEFFFLKQKRHWHIQENRMCHKCVMTKQMKRKNDNSDYTPRAKKLDTKEYTSEMHIRLSITKEQIKLKDLIFGTEGEKEMLIYGGVVPQA